MNSHCLRTILFILVAAATATSQTKSDPINKAGLLQCEQQIGFQLLTDYDLSRPSLSEAEKGRWMQIAVWYPAVGPFNSQPLSIKDLVALSATEATQSADNAARSKAVESFIQQSVKDGASRQGVDTLLNSHTDAYLDAKPASGKFPLIIFLHSSPPGENIIAQKLAQCGFVVAGTVSKGTSEPQYRLSIPNIQTMITDTAFVLNAVRRLHFVHDSALGLIGMSNGALSAVLMQLRNPEVHAIVSLDGTIGEEVAEKVFAKDPYYNPLSVRSSIMHLYTTENPHLSLKTISSFNNAERYLVAMPKMRHYDFLSFGAYEKVAPGIGGTPIMNHSSGFDWSLLFTIHFFKARLQNNPNSQLFLRNALTDNPAAEWIMSIEQHPTNSLSTR